MKQLKTCAVLLGVLALASVIALTWKHSWKAPGAAPASNLTLTSAPRLQRTVPARVELPASAAPVGKSEASSPQPFPELRDFSVWAGKFSAGSNNLSTAEGEDLARKRRAVMVRLIQTDPEKALAWTVPARWRTELPASVTQYFEQRVDGRGPLNVAVATDFEKQTSKVLRDTTIGGQHYNVFVYGRRLDQVSQASIPIHGITLDGQLAVHVDPVRILEPVEVAAAEKAGAIVRERICGVSGKPSNYRNQEVTADLGGEIIFCCGVGHVDLINQRLAAAEGGNNDTTPGNEGPGVIGWTQGKKNVLYMRVNFPDDLREPISLESAYATMNGVNDFYVTSSYGTTSLTPTVTPLLMLPQSKDWYATAGAGALLGDARAVAKVSGYDTANFDLDIVVFTSVPGYDFGGLAFVGGKGVWLQSPGVGVTSHELGHNYGLWHANFWDTSTTNGDSVIGPGAHEEYGNIYDTMGAASAGNNQFNAMHKNRLHWLPDLFVHDVASNGVYRIFAFDVPQRVDGQFYAAKVKKDFQRDYWIEFRQLFKSNPWQQNGVLLNWSPWALSHGGTHLLDTTPDSPNGKDDAPVVIGRTYTDAPAGVHITPVAHGVVGTNLFIDVQVNAGTFPTNQPPILSIEVQPQIATPGTPIYFHATAFDPDGDTLAYSWTFDDFTFSTNNLPWTIQTWNAPGQHVVHCEVSDMKGGVASANALVTIGSPGGFLITGTITDLNGDPVEGVRVDGGLTNGPYFGGFTDSDGNYIIANASGQLTLNAVKYGYTFTNLTWTNPVTDVITNADWVATPVQAVMIAASTNAVLENSSDINYFTVTRTGDLATNLTISLYLSGTADLGSDYTLNPPPGANVLAPGTNVYDFPPGSNQLQFAFQTINDSLVEGPETVTLTVLEDTNYINGSLGEATITIIDDDVPSKSTVSVAATTSSGDNSVIESDPNGGAFIFTRNGSTANDLTVNYSVSGSATPGVDYQALLGVVIIPAGSSSVSVPFRIIDDTLVETNETVIVTVSSSPSYTADTSAATITIIDDDLINVSIYPTRPAFEPSTAGKFTVVRTGDLAPNLVVNYSIGGTATSGADYVALSGSVIIPGGQSSADITVTPLADNLLEGDESVIITLLANTNYSVGEAGIAAIAIHDAQLPTVTIVATDPTASEPGTDTGEFRISRGSAVNGDLTVNLGISGTAVNGADYVPLDNTVVIPNGSSSVTLEVIPFDNLYWGTNETVILTLVAGTNYNIGAGNSAVVTIMDEDSNNVPAVSFTFTASSAVESQSPGVSVSLTATSTVPISVDYIYIGGTAPSSRFQFTPGTLTFAPGEAAKSLPLAIVNDSVVEPNQTIRLAIINPVNATLGQQKIHTYTILDDDAGTVSVSATVPAASENGPVAGNFRFSRAGPTNAAMVVNFEVTGTASAPSDYASIGNSVTIPAGASFLDVPISPVRDITKEYPETVVVTLSSAPGANIGSPSVAIVTIADNNTNTLPIVSVTSTNQPVAVRGTTNNGAFVFTRTGSTTGALAVLFSIGGTAVNGTDYATLSNSVTFAPGQSSLTLPVMALDVHAVAGEERAIVTLTDNSTYQVLYPASATVLIQETNQTVRLEATDFIASKVGPDPGQFTFTRVGTTNADVEVLYSISGTASNGVDYATITNFVIIPATQLSNTLTILPLIDNIPVGPRTVTLTLLSASGYNLSSPTSATVTINDNMPGVGLVGVATNASEDGEHPGIITITRQGDPQIDFTAHLSVGGTATYGVDYPPFQTNVFFCCGMTSYNLYIYPTNDLLIEGTETVSVTLLPDPTNYTIQGASNVVVTIDDVGTNRFPVVDITRPATNLVFLTMVGTNVGMILNATVTDDGILNPTLTTTWTNINGADTNTYQFGDTNSASTTVVFNTNGVFVLELIADDGQLRTRKDITVVVNKDIALAPDLLYWNLDDGGGTTALDTTTNGHNGTLAGSNDWVTNGMINGAVSLGGTNDYVSEASGKPFLDGLKALSISMWIKSATPNPDVGFISANDSDTTDQTFALRALAYDARSHGTNVIEATIPSRKGTVRYVSASNTTTNQWQHVAVTWTNGSAPIMFINGQLDMPTFPPLVGKGYLTNCLQFIAGKGPGDGANSWNGLIDDVRLYKRPLQAGEIAALAALPPANLAPVVNVGSNVTVQINLPVEFDGVVSDDGQPNPPGLLTNGWSVVTNAGPVTFTPTNSATNTFIFGATGDYVLRLISDDGQVAVFGDVDVTVTEPTDLSLSASIPDAAELGPVVGQFTLQRVGDLSVPMTVYLDISGIASNGVDYVTMSNAVVIPAGQDTLQLPVTPFLDLKTEGDESVIFTLVSNAAYTIQSGPATVTIHDSPYGQWSIANFSLEELTNPKLTGPTADFDHDGLINFAEYALNRDPKAVETNAPVATVIQVDPNDGLNHVMVTYQRRVMPTDVRYGLFVSGDMVNWSTNYVQELSATADPNGLTETVVSEVLLPYSTSTNQFINLRIWQPAQ